MSLMIVLLFSAEEQLVFQVGETIIWTESLYKKSFLLYIMIKPVGQIDPHSPSTCPVSEPQWISCDCKGHDDKNI